MGLNHPDPDDGKKSSPTLQLHVNIEPQSYVYDETEVDVLLYKVDTQGVHCLFEGDTPLRLWVLKLLPQTPKESEATGPEDWILHLPESNRNVPWN